MASEDGATTTTATATRCYWAILNSSMAFQYLDPVFQQHMKEQASSMLGKQLTDFIHPEENLVAQEDFAKFQSSGIIFGSVTRCRYAKISHCRKILGAEDVAQEDENNQWISARITSSLVAPNTVLAFFHEIPEDADETAAADGNDCGPTSTEVSGDLFNSNQIEMLTKAFTSCQADSEEVKSKIADQTFRLKTDPFPPPYVFQLLATGSDNIIFTWPPVKGTGDDADTAANGTTPDNGNGERYQPVECAALARSVALPTGGADAGEASTNCTKRYQSKHPVLAEGGFTNVESVVITYQGLTIVCFRSGGLALNRNIFSPPDLSVADNSSSKRKDVSDPAEDEAIKRIRTAISQHDSGDMPVPNVESLNTSWHPDGQQFTNIPNSPGLGGNTQVPQWTNDDPNSANSLQSPYYGSYPSVYSNMFSNDGRSSGNFMDGSTNIPPMPAPSQPTGSNGLANLALASSSSYYTDYNKQGQQLPVVQGQENQYQNTNQNNGNNIPTGSGSDVTPSPVTPALSQSGEQAMPVVHRVRKNDRGRICTSCGTTNSPEWRKGPSGIKTLCNACGLRYSRAQTRKLKKAQKQQDAENQAVPNSADGSFASAGPNDPYGALPPKPIQIPNSASTATGPTSAGTPHSPFIPIGDYSVHAPLPPLPTPAQDDPPHSAGSTNGSGSNNIPTGATGNGNYGAYGNYVNYAFDQWGSPTQTSFSQGQQGGN